MSDVKWIKIATDIFDNDKIQLIEAMPEADAVITIWFKLLCLAGKQNNSGVFTLNNGLAYTDEMFSAVFHRPLNTVRLAMSTFRQFGMIDEIDGCTAITNWDKYQSLEAYEASKEKARIRKAKSRERQKLLAGKSENVTGQSRDSHGTVTPIESDIESEEDKDLDNLSESNDSDRRTEARRVVEAWNSLGLAQVQSIKAGSQRYTMLNARIREHGVETVVKAVENIRHSAFLRGQSKNGWVITFDWFVKPNNFVKVLENQYADRASTPPPGQSKTEEGRTAQDLAYMVDYMARREATS